MMVLCLWQITPEYFTEMTEASVLQGKEVLKSCYGILAAFSGIGLLPFLLKDVEKRGTAGKPVVLGIVTLGGILMGMLVLIRQCLDGRDSEMKHIRFFPFWQGQIFREMYWQDLMYCGWDFFYTVFCLPWAVCSITDTGSSTGPYGKRETVAACSDLRAVPDKISGDGNPANLDFYLSRIFVPGLLLIQVFMALRGNAGDRKK